VSLRPRVPPSAVTPNQAIAHTDAEIRAACPTAGASRAGTTHGLGREDHGRGRVGGAYRRGPHREAGRDEQHQLGQGRVGIDRDRVEPRVATSPPGVPSAGGVPGTPPAVLG